MHDRFLAVLRGRTPDRLPFVIDWSYGTGFTSGAGTLLEELRGLCCKQEFPMNLWYTGV